LLIRKWSFKIIGIDFIVRGEENLDKYRPCVFISNHQNNMDLIAGSSCFPKRTVTLGKKSLARIPLFGWFYVLSGNILIDRKNRAKSSQSMEKVRQRIAGDKVSVWILPEGTRSRGRGLLPFKRGAFMTAISASVPIVPIVYSSYHHKMKWNQWSAGKVLVQVMEPIYTDGLEIGESHQMAQDVYGVFKEKLDQLDLELEG